MEDDGDHHWKRQRTEESRNQEVRHQDSSEDKFTVFKRKKPNRPNKNSRDWLRSQGRQIGGKGKGHGGRNWNRDWEWHRDRDRERERDRDRQREWERHRERERDREDEEKERMAAELKELKKKVQDLEKAKFNELKDPHYGNAQGAGPMGVWQQAPPNKRLAVNGKRGRVAIWAPPVAKWIVATR